MTEWSPPTSRSRVVLAVLGVVWFLWFAYSLIILQQILLGFLVGVALLVCYLGWRLLVAIEAIADAQQRLAAERERGRD